LICVVSAALKALLRALMLAVKRIEVVSAAVVVDAAVAVAANRIEAVSAAVVAVDAETDEASCAGVAVEVSVAVTVVTLTAEPAMPLDKGTSSTE
jgi:hypothetical protein